MGAKILSEPELLEFLLPASCVGCQFLTQSSPRQDTSSLHPVRSSGYSTPVVGYCHCQSARLGLQMDGTDPSPGRRNSGDITFRGRFHVLQTQAPATTECNSLRREFPLAQPDHDAEPQRGCPVCMIAASKISRTGPLLHFN